MGPGALPVRAAGPRTFTVDPARSQALIEVGKGGLFSFAAGHVHEVEAPIASGVVHFDPADPSRADVRLEFDAAALRVTGKGEPAGDVPKVQQIMLSEQVLDVRRYPKIALESTSVSIVAGKTPGPTMFDLTIAGNLALHGVTRRSRRRSASARGRYVDGDGQAVHQTDRLRHQAHLGRRRGQRQGRPEHRLHHRRAGTIESASQEEQRLSMKFFNKLAVAALALHVLAGSPPARAQAAEQAPIGSAPGPLRSWPGRRPHPSPARTPLPPGPQGRGRSRPLAAPLNFNNQTLRQIVHTSIGGDRVRVVLSNAFGTARSSSARPTSRCARSTRRSCLLRRGRSPSAAVRRPRSPPVRSRSAIRSASPCRPSPISRSTFFCPATPARRPRP